LAMLRGAGKGEDAGGLVVAARDAALVGEIKQVAGRKPELIETVAPVRAPPLSGSLSAIAPSSVTAAPPPVKVAVAPATTVGATCTTFSVVVVVPVPLLELASVPAQSMGAAGARTAAGRIAVRRIEAVGHRIKRGLIVAHRIGAAQRQRRAREIVGDRVAALLRVPLVSPLIVSVSPATDPPIVTVAPVSRSPLSTSLPSTSRQEPPQRRRR